MACISCSSNIEILFFLLTSSISYIFELILTHHCVRCFNPELKSTKEKCKNPTVQLFDGTHTLASCFCTLTQYSTSGHEAKLGLFPFRLWPPDTMSSEEEAENKSAHQRSDCKTICGDEPAALCSEYSTKTHSKQTGMCT